MRQEVHKRKMEKIKAGEKCLHGKLEKLKTELTTAQEAMDGAKSYVEGQKKISHGLNVKDMIEVEAGIKLIEFGRQKLVRDSVTYLRKEIKLRVSL